MRQAMPMPVSVARQCLTEEAARALDDAVAAARRRSHTQTTSLHAVSALLALPSSTLRDACGRARSSAYSSRLQFRALELCVGVSLDRLPTSKSVEDPPVSNSLMAAIKRSQANQRRNPENYHLQQIHCNQQTASLLKVEMKYFILSILDDPMVSRVFGEAGFRSTDIKLAILHPPVTQISPRLPRSRCPPIFLCNLTDSGFGFSPDPGRVGPSFPFGYEDVDENCRRIGEVLVKRIEKNGKNPLLVGVCAGNALKGFVETVNSGKLGILPKEIYGLDIFCIEKEIYEFVVEKGREEMMGLRFKELESVIEQCSGPGVVVNFGEVKMLVDDNVSSEAVRFVVSKLSSLLEINSRRLWLIGAAASYETYLKFLAKFPSIEKDWDLHLLPIHSKSSLMGSFVPFGGFFSSPLDIKNPVRSKDECSTCYLCTEKFEQEVKSFLKKGSTFAVADQYSEKLPSYLGMAEVETSRGVEMAKTKDDAIEVPEVLELQKKWSETCKRLHHTQLLPKLDISPMRSQGLMTERQFMTDKKESSSNDPPANESQCANPGPGGHMGLQKIFPEKQNTSMPLAPEAENVDFQSKLMVNLSKNQQTKNEGRLPSYSLHNLTKPPDHMSYSSASSVTTDLGLGTMYASTRQETDTPKLQDHEERAQHFSGSISAEVDAVSESSSHHVAQSSTCSTPNSGEHFDPRDYKTLRKVLAEKVGWQDAAISTISQAVARCRTGYGRHRDPKGRGDIWLTFLGPDRIGKKKIASALAEIMFGRRGKLISVDLSSQEPDNESNSIFECQELNGYDRKFRGKHVVDCILEELRDEPYSVVFLENVDKADVLAQSKLSQAITTGKFSDSHGRSVNINNMIFVTTSMISKGNDSVLSEKKLVKFSEEVILGAKRWQMQTLISCGSEEVSSGNEMNVKITPRKETSNQESMNKRKLIETSDSTSESSKRGHKLMRSHLDLNVPIDETGEDFNGGGYDSDSMSEGTEAWLEDFLDQVDEKVVFKPFNFDVLADKMMKLIKQQFQRTIGSQVLLEIDYEVMVQILAAAWLSNTKRAVEDWIEKVLGRSFSEIQQKYHLITGNVVKLVSCESLLAEEQAPGVCLPAKLMCQCN